MQTKFLKLALCLFMLTPLFASDLKFIVGAGSRNQTPIVFLTGISYKRANFIVQGMGVHNRVNDYWCAFRTSLLLKFFNDLPFNFDTGIGVGYEYAEAPNNMHKALNKANSGRYLYPYNYKENMDISLEIWTHLYGFYTQIGVPIHQFKKHDTKNVLWGAGYLVEF